MSGRSAERATVVPIRPSADRIRPTVLKRLLWYLEQLDVEQLQVIEVVAIAIVRGGVR